MRGIRYIHVPTSLLAHDSSIGGKVALNIGDIKILLVPFINQNLYSMTYLLY